ncbi:prephenate dehydrogenase [Klugiella xanthotipulae]|uniref:Prephenate dehydrogenase n=1 Tax=Klugiella xanthotipulae TaxID=244735 RepID=A0A543I3V1_9MICO|nr:prephenate dehydrogenase [Klugiella xanthotipulae]TQM65276.1 prephenate dehydrogenase [Klugiella xanthotipulae]
MNEPERSARLAGPVRVVGAGLLGASIGLALCAHGVDVILDDASPSALDLAIDYGAGRRAAVGDAPVLVVVCVPPDVTAPLIERELAAHPDAVVTDVASVKLEPFLALQRRGVDLTRYIGSHPLSGRERGGAISARADLFYGRPWVICRDAETPGWALGLVEDLALDLGSTPLEMTPEEHDRSVALVSHVPQVVASLLAARLIDAPEIAVALAGQGVRDTTRIASSDPSLWLQILRANAEPVVEVLRDLSRDLDTVVAALTSINSEGEATPGTRRAIADAIAAGNAGVARLPGKHGQNRRFVTLTVMVDDTPGALGRLLTELGEIGVNMEDLRLEHSPGAQIGFAEIAVVPEVKQRAIDDLVARGWRIAGL